MIWEQIAQLTKQSEIDNETFWQQKFQSLVLFTGMARTFCLGTLGCTVWHKAQREPDTKGRLGWEGFSIVCVLGSGVKIIFE